LKFNRHPREYQQKTYLKMTRLIANNRLGPIGVDIGSRSVKLLQFTRDHERVVDASRWDLPYDNSETLSTPPDELSAAIRKARSGRRFRGKNAVLCLSEDQLFLQNIRVPKVDAPEMDRHIRQEIAGRLSFSIAEAEIRYVEAADIRHGDAVMREVIVMACHRPVLDNYLGVIEAAGLRPIAVDVEPLALHRSYWKQCRRDADRNERVMLVNLGFARTSVVISQGNDVLFVKYIDVAGRNMDQAVAKHLDMKLTAATALRRHNGDRRTDQQDPDIARGVAEATRPIVEKLLSELSMCFRYHSVTFRGQSLARMVLSGGEANTQLLELLSTRLNLKAEISDPLRAYPLGGDVGRSSQWDVAAGLALKN